MADSFNVTPWNVDGKVNYEILERNFGIKPLNQDLLKRIQKHTGTLHPFIRREIYFGHRELDWLLDMYEKGEKFCLYTGIAPSNKMTIGHLLPFMMTLWLQQKFDAEVLIQIPDEEKYLAGRRKGAELDEFHDLAKEAALDIAALGFDPKKTRIFLDTEYSKTLYKQAVRVARRITFSTIKDAFGMGNDTNIGMIFYTSMQAVPSFLKSVEEGKKVPCLIPLGVDQDVHFRVARDVIEKLGYYKPAIIHGKFLPGLSGDSKMSASKENDAVYLDDNEETVRKKINKALTGQQSTAELQREKGGDPDKCMVCQYYKFLFEPDDAKLEQIFEAERKGTILAGEHKQDLAKRVNLFLEQHRKKRNAVNERIDEFMERD
jgi:tryptophanyl-tRNA synthetase